MFKLFSEYLFLTLIYCCCSKYLILELFFVCLIETFLFFSLSLSLSYCIKEIFLVEFNKLFTNCFNVFSIMKELVVLKKTGQKR